MKKYIILCLFSLSLHGADPGTQNGFVFDLEGTLAATEWVWFKANDQILEKHGITIDNAAQEKLDTMPAGCGLEHSIELLIERFGLSGSVENLIQEKVNFGQKNIEDNNFEYYPDVENFLAETKNRQLGMAIATNCGQTALKILKEKLKLSQHFGEHIYNPDHVGRKAKPNPALYLYAVQQLGLDPKKCIAFEDSPSGARAAAEAGLYVVGYDSSSNPKLADHSDRVVTEWSDLDVDELVMKVND